MKNLIITIITIQVAVFSACAQGKKASKQAQTIEFSSVDTTLKTQLNNVLDSYYQLKDALVSSNEKLAATKAAAFETALQNVQTSSMTAEQRKFYQPLSTDLAYDVEHIKNAPNVDHMREHFSTFSNNMWLIVKAFKANNGQTAFQDYCPMEKAYWISKDEAIKNPYFGAKMMTCGKISESIK